MQEEITGAVIADAETLLALGGGAGRARGGSRFFKFHTSPSLETIQWAPDGFRRITGFCCVAPANWVGAITKNGMTISSNGLADAGGTALPEGSQVASDQIIWAGINVSGSGFVFTALNHIVEFGETLFISKNQASAVNVIIYFDFS